MDTVGKYSAWITRNGLRLITKPGISLVRHIELTPEEALTLLQALYGKRDILLQAVRPDMQCWLFSCPHCQIPCSLEITPTGYDGSCAQCGNDFTLNFSGHLLDRHYSSYEDE